MNLIRVFPLRLLRSSKLFHKSLVLFGVLSSFHSCDLAKYFLSESKAIYTSQQAFRKQGFVSEKKKWWQKRIGADSRWNSRLGWEAAVRWSDSPGQRQRHTGSEPRRGCPHYQGWSSFVRLSRSSTDSHLVDPPGGLHVRRFDVIEYKFDFNKSKIFSTIVLSEDSDFKTNEKIRILKQMINWKLTLRGKEIQKNYFLFTSSRQIFLFWVLIILIFYNYKIYRLNLLSNEFNSLIMDCVVLCNNCLHRTFNNKNNAIVTTVVVVVMVFLWKL